MQFKLLELKFILLSSRIKILRLLNNSILIYFYLSFIINEIYKNISKKYDWWIVNCKIDLISILVEKKKDNLSDTVYIMLYKEITCNCKIILRVEKHKRDKKYLRNKKPWCDEWTLVLWIICLFFKLWWKQFIIF